MSLFKGFSNLIISKRLEKENTVFNFIVYFIHKKVPICSLKLKNKLKQMFENTIKIIHCLAFFLEIFCVLFFYFYAH